MDVSIVTSGHDVADARLHREVAALVKAGLTIEVRGLGDPTDGPAGAAVRARKRAGGVRRAWRALTWPWHAKGRVLVALDPDSAVGAWLFTACHPRSRRFVADVHEDYGLLLRDRDWARGVRGWSGRIWARLGRLAARGADRLVVADEHLMAEVTDRIVMRNLPDASMLPEPGDRGPVPRALYVGDLRRSRGLFAMLDAIRDAPGWELDLVGPIAGGDRAEAVARLADPVLADRVRWHGLLPPRESWELARGAWVGLLLLEHTPAFREAIPSKLYEYLTCGLAVITTDLPRSAELVAESGAGIVVLDVSQASAALRSWTADPSRLDALRVAARVWSETPRPEPTEEFVSAVRALALDS